MLWSAPVRVVFALLTDTVMTDLTRRPVTMMWAPREALLAECRKLEGMRRVIAEFEDAGTSRAARLTNEPKAHLLVLLRR